MLTNQALYTYTNDSFSEQTEKFPVTNIQSAQPVDQGETPGMLPNGFKVAILD